jgi:polyhydroxyalkanoate synthesis regulator phasin
MNIMAIMLFIVAVVFPIMALNKAHKLGERVEELETRIKELENKREK